jgi:DNA-binding SARP family transcriptional activator
MLPSCDEDVDSADAGCLFADILPDWYDDWIDADRERFHELRVAALESLCTRLSERHRYADAVQAGLAAVGADPYRETSRLKLMEAHLAQGNVGAALHQYEVYRDLLDQKFGIEPSPQLESFARGMRYCGVSAVPSAA